MGLPFTARMMSPSTSRPYSSRVVPCTPALAAGPPSRALRTMIPLTPSVSTACSGAKEMPRMGRTTRPYCRMLPTLLLMVSDGMANPMPELEPDGEKMAVLMPMTQPELSKSGPPLLPGLMAASVWMTPWMGRPVSDWISRSVPDTTPVVRVKSRPKGLPMAYTRCPTCRPSTLGSTHRGCSWFAMAGGTVVAGKGGATVIGPPAGAGPEVGTGPSVASPSLNPTTCRTAMSLSGSTPTTLAMYSALSWPSVTLTLALWLMTW
mmetsp:Transcript_1360/g.3715  ORF Transcript_1360/g.3715 Transcript_1360/m.3715 type:complete len:263 (+) Transcript_1360:542-1330(+)